MSCPRMHEATTQGPLKEHIESPKLSADSRARIPLSPAHRKVQPLPSCPGMSFLVPLEDAEGKLDPFALHGCKLAPSSRAQDMTCALDRVRNTGWRQGEHPVLGAWTWGRG